MTTPRELYLEAARRGLSLEAAGGDKLAVRPKGKCPPAFADELRAHKAAILLWLADPPCPGWEAIPPPGLPLGTIQPRPTPADRERVILHMRRQTGDRTGPLTAWLVRRENAYFDGPGARWDCALICYAAARDAACWQLSRTERDVWLTLAAFDEAARTAGR